MLRTLHNAKAHMVGSVNKKQGINRPIREAVREEKGRPECTSIQKKNFYGSIRSWGLRHLQGGKTKKKEGNGIVILIREKGGTSIWSDWHWYDDKKKKNQRF